MVELQTYTVVRDDCNCTPNSSVQLAPTATHSPMLLRSQPTTPGPATSGSYFPWKFVGCSAIACLCAGIGWNLANSHLTKENLMLRSQIANQGDRIAELSEEQRSLKARQKAFLNCVQHLQGDN